MDDNLQEEEIRNLQLWSYEVTYKLIQEMKKGKPVLVHCAAGMQRSAAVTAMYLIATHRMRPEQAKTYIQNKRPIAFRPGAIFLDLLTDFINPLIKKFFRSWKTNVATRINS